MPASYAAALAAALLAITWMLGRRRVPLVRDVDTSAVAALNRAQIALVQGGGGLDRARGGFSSDQTNSGRGLGQPTAAGASLQPTDATPERSFAWETPAGSAELRPPGRDGLQRHRFNSELRARYRQAGPARLAAIQAARHWGDRCTLPLLRQALRDPDPAVVREAAAAIERFRGRPGPTPPPEVQPLPRRVARTR